MARFKKQNDILPDIAKIFVKDNPQNERFSAVQISNNFMTASDARIFLTIDLEKLNINQFKNKTIYLDKNEAEKIAFKKIQRIDENNKLIFAEDTYASYSEFSEKFPPVQQVSNFFADSLPSADEPSFFNPEYLEALKNVFKRINNIYFSIQTKKVNSFAQPLVFGYITVKINSTIQTLGKFIIMPINMPELEKISRFDKENFFPDSKQEQIINENASAKENTQQYPKTETAENTIDPELHNANNEPDIETNMEEIEEE